MNRLTLFVCAACLLRSAAFAQSLDSSLNEYNNKYPQEKLHIHFDKDTYLPGETVWMKAYLLSDSRPSAVSKNLYFDWTDADGRLLLHSVSPITEGSANSFFKIPAWVKNGVIHLKAYTQWMLNFDNAFLYNKNIPVLMPVEGAFPVPDKLQTTVSFFPEGGDLINGVPSILAFEALNQHNKPSSIKGIIKTSENIIVDSFQTTYNGMGILRLKPMAGEHYNAYWSDETGELHTSPIPDAKANGLVLHADPYNNGQIHYKLEKSADASKLTNIVVLGTINQKIVYRNSLTLQNNMAEANISAGSFPCGILQLTAFDRDMSPLAERVVFVNNEKAYAKIQLRNEAVGLNKRSRNEISIEMPDSLVTNLSVSVTDAGLGFDSSNNIYSDLLIAGDLKGTIPDAASFLSSPAASAEANDHLNLLLLTHGWRRFNWESVVTGKFPELKYARDPGFLSIKGGIRNGSNLDAQDSMALLMISRDRKKHILKLPVDDQGKFEQDGLFFYDSVQVVYRFNHAAKLGNNAQISLFSGLLPALTPAKADEPSFAWMKVPDVILEKEMNGNLIETQDNSIPSPAMSYIVSPTPDSVGRNSESAAHYLSDNFVDLRFAVSLKENAPAGETRLASYRVNSFALRSNVNVTLDGTPVAMDDLKSVNMKEVLFIKFLPRTNQKGLPTLAITSRQALDQSNILDNKTGYAVITGYTPVREFYQIHYENKIEDFQATDFRSTLYWNPKFRLDKAHRKVSFVFYNNDISNKFRVVVEGMNQEGKLCRIEEIIK
jgi:hypothetical protein